jgi:hypothetical protein
MKIFSLHPSSFNQTFSTFVFYFYFLLYRNTATRPATPITASKPGRFVLGFGDEPGLSFCPGVLLVFAVLALPVFVCV